jgi:hypothetical protein
MFSGMRPVAYVRGYGFTARGCGPVCKRESGEACVQFPHSP